MRPGRTVACERSMIAADGGIDTFLPTSLILFPSIRITAFSSGLSDLPSISLPHLIAVNCWEKTAMGQAMTKRSVRNDFMGILLGGVPWENSYRAASSSSAAVKSMSDASSSIVCATFAISSSASFHCFCSIASRTPGIVFTPYPV